MILIKSKFKKSLQKNHKKLLSEICIDINKELLKIDNIDVEIVLYHPPENYSVHKDSTILKEIINRYKEGGWDIKAIFYDDYSYRTGFLRYLEFTIGDEKW